MHPDHLWGSHLFPPCLPHTPILTVHSSLQSSAYFSWKILLSADPTKNWQEPSERMIP